MVEQDTIKLLRECDAGVKMGISSIEDVLDNVEDKKFEKLFTFLFCYDTIYLEILNNSTSR